MVYSSFWLNSFLQLILNVQELYPTISTELLGVFYAKIMEASRALISFN